MWEEVGFYEGFARMWKAVYQREASAESRASHNIKLLLDLIAQFPVVNPSASAPSDLDLSKLLSQIRSRYKMLCATVGVKPSLRASNVRAEASDADTDREPKGSKPLWKLDNIGGSKAEELSF